ncbi:MAG TPA: FAD-dependent monooxygenase, partial [Mucilaginibacter sp.]
IIDNKQGPTDKSKALAVQARSMEIFRQLGVVDKVLGASKAAAGAVINQENHEVASLTLNGIAEGQTPFPYIYMYQQSKTERLLLDYLTLNCCPVYWGTTLLGIEQDASKATVLLQTGAETQTISCDWLIAADGARSPVRKQLQIPFNGDTYGHQFYVADVKIENALNNKVRLYLSNKGFAAFFLMPEDHYCRIVGILPNEFDNREGLQMEDVLPYLDTITGASIKVEHTNWFTTYKLHHRMADKFRRERCFLIGDAAHIHSPVGGQGMNTGLQDAYNLAWKLAGVINSQLKPAILDSYGAERMPVAKDLLNTTDRVFKLILSRNWFVSLFKKWVLPRLLEAVWSSPPRREAFFTRISQIGISYRDSRLNLHLSQATRIKAGDRLPFLKVFDEKKQQETDLHEWCSKPGFTMITMGKLTELDLFTLAKWITQTYPANLNFFYLPLSAKNQTVFDAFEIKENQKKAVIVRPDLHIGFINDAVDIDMMNNYLQNVVGFITR